MPRLGEPMEPAHTESVRPWWRVTAAHETARTTALGETSLPKAVPWPID
jgi:hypothetical protein